MSLNIKRAEAYKLAHELARFTNETVTEAVIKALEERLLREKGKKAPSELKEIIIKICHRAAKLPDLDTRTPDEIIGYDQHGLPN